MVIRRLPQFAAMLLLLLSPEIRAQSTASIRTHFASEKIDHAPTLSVWSNLALIDVSVLDRNGKPLRGLPPSSFHLFEHGAEQKIVSVSETDVPISAALVLDESRSMGKGVRRCAEAVQKFLEQCNDSDEFALISFADRVVVESDFTRDAGTIQNRILQAKSQGNTALLDAVRSAAMMMRHAHNQRRVILVLSDGDDNQSRSHEAEVQRILLETEAQVYAVSIPQQKPLSYAAREVWLPMVTGCSGAWVRPCADRTTRRGASHHRGEQQLQDAADETGAGVGLQNIRRRLEICCGPGATLRLVPDSHKTTAEISIPLAAVREQK